MGARLTLVLLAAAALPLAAQTPPADTAETYPVTGYVGRMALEGEDLDLVGIEVMQVRPGRMGTRMQIGTWREAVAEGATLVEVEAGPTGAVPLARGLAFVPTGGLMVAAGNGLAWGLYGNVGLLVEPHGRLVGRLTVGRHWYRIDQEFLGATTWTVGLGWRLGPYPPSGGRAPWRGIH